MEERKTYFQTWLDKNIPKKKQNLSVQFFDNFFEHMLVNSSHPRENANLELFGLNKYLDEKHSKEDIAIAEVYKIRLEAFLQGASRVSWLRSFPLFFSLHVCSCFQVPFIWHVKPHR